MDMWRERYLHDGDFRREQALQSLANPDNLYARQRIEDYGLQDRGWDLLPEWVPVSSELNEESLEQLQGGDATHLGADARPVWDGERPSSPRGWVELGRQVFQRYPIRADRFVEHALRAGVAEDHGLAPDFDGTYRGVVVFRDVDAEVRVGITCALCHSAEQAGQWLPGAARRAFNYGSMRVARYEATGEPLRASERARLLSWGPGRADITEDEDGDPVSIPDLWGLSEQSALTQTGAIRQRTPVALAIRQETQLLHANHQRARPPRELAWALAMYLHSLRPPEPTPSADARAGRAIFDAQCASCHSNAAYGGPAVPAASVGTDPRLAQGKARGTGLYRPASLLGVSHAGPYFHDGSVATLQEVLNPARLRSDYTAGPLGPGPVPGHAFGTQLPLEDRHLLLAFLRSL